MCHLYRPTKRASGNKMRPRFLLDLHPRLADSTTSHKRMPSMQIRSPVRRTNLSFRQRGQVKPPKRKALSQGSPSKALIRETVGRRESSWRAFLGNGRRKFLLYRRRLVWRAIGTIAYVPDAKPCEKFTREIWERTSGGIETGAKRLGDGAIHPLLHFLCDSEFKLLLLKKSHCFAGMANHLLVSQFNYLMFTPT